MKNKRNYFRASIPAAARLRRFISRIGKIPLFPSCNKFLRSIFPRANERFGPFCFAPARRVGGLNSTFPSVSGVI
jgi:hypothetical protein